MPSTLPSKDTLATLGGPYRIPVPLNQRQQLALWLLAEIWQLKDDAGQTDYTTNHVQLYQDAVTATNGMTLDQVQAALVGEAWNVAKGIAGAPQTLNDQLSALKLLMNRPDEDLQRMFMFIRYLKMQATGD